MNEIEHLRKQLNEGRALDELRNHHGWKEFSKIVQEVYNDNIILLAEEEDPSARAMLKAIKVLNEKFLYKIDLAKDAANELKKDKFIEPWDTAE